MERLDRNEGQRIQECETNVNDFFEAQLEAKAIRIAEKDAETASERNSEEEITCQLANAMTLIKKENMYAVMDVAVTHERLQNREQASKARELSQEKEIEEICQQMQLQQQQLAKVMESVHKLQEANALQQQLIERKIVDAQQQE